MLLLEQDITRKGQVDENMTKLDIGNDESKKYKVEAICDSVVYAKKSKSDLPWLFYFVV